MDKLLKKSPLMLNLGCGNRGRIPGFVNIDLSRGKNIDIIANVRRLPMINNDSVDLIYASHVLEYFDCEEVIKVLAEWKRTLKTGGILRIAVPDFAALCTAYRILNYPISNLTGPLYGRMKVGRTYIYHKTCYDYFSLINLLTNCGFKNVKRYDWRETIHKNYDDWSQSYLPHMDKDKGLLISLNMEAVKP